MSRSSYQPALRVAPDPLVEPADTSNASRRTCKRYLPDDRYLRFGYPASDEQIDRYVETIDFAHDEVFGVFNRRLELVAAGAPCVRAIPADVGQTLDGRVRRVGAAAGARPRLR